MSLGVENQILSMGAEWIYTPNDEISNEFPTVAVFPLGDDAHTFDNYLHFYFASDRRWYLQTKSGGVANPYVDIALGDLLVPMVADGKTIYRLEIIMDLSTNMVFIKLPDKQIVKYYVSNLVQVAKKASHV